MLSVRTGLWALFAALFLTEMKATAQLGGGELDVTFGVGGKSIATLPGFNLQAFGCERQADGKIIVAGQAWDGGTIWQMVVSRFNADGSLDTDFGAGGFALYGPTAGLRYCARAVKVLADGKILVAGDTTGSVMTVRFLSTGALDDPYAISPQTFGTGAEVTSLAIDADGQAVVTATALETGKAIRDGFILRYLAGGEPHPSLGRQNTHAPAAGVDDEASHATVLANGKILFVSRVNGQMLMNRQTSAGLPDVTFNGTGRVTFSPANGMTTIKGMTVDAVNNMVILGHIGGNATNDVVLFRMTPEGRDDYTFSGDASLPTRLGSGTSVPTGVVTQPDGRVLICGHLSSPAGTVFVVRRFHGEGAADLSFGTGGLVSTVVGEGVAETAGMLTQPDGKIVVAGSALAAGSSHRGLAVVRYEPGLALTMPVITQPPSDLVVPMGTTQVTFSVTAEAVGPMTYTWYRNNVLLTRGPGSTYTMFHPHYSSEGTYRVEVRSGFYVTSAEFTFKLLDPPKIVEGNSLILRGMAGAYASNSFGFPLTGRRPMTCKWFKGQTEIGQTTTGSNWDLRTYLPLSEMKSSDAGFYHFEVSNSDGVAVSPEYELRVFPEPGAEITTAGHLVDLGDSCWLYAELIFSTDARLQWKKNGAAISRETNGYLTVPEVKMTDAGAYTITIRNSKGTYTSAPAQIAVFDRTGSSHLLAHNKKFSIALKIAGKGLAYQWFKGDDEVVNDGRISGADSAVLTFKTLSVDDAGDYTCHVSAFGKTKVSGTHSLQVAAAVPVIGEMALPAAQIGVAYHHDPELPALASHFEFSGLPAGFSYSKTENRIIGKPSKPGTFPVKMVAVNPVGRSVSKPLSLVVNALPEGIEGRYYSQASDGYAQGTIDILVGPAGSYSGKLFLCDLKGRSTTASFTGQISHDNGPAGEQPVPAQLTSGTTTRLGTFYPKSQPATVSLKFDGSICEGTIQVFYMMDGNETESAIGLHAPNCPWNARKPLPLSHTGQFNVALDSQSEPQGTGPAKVTVTTAGIWSMAGKLPDGTSVTTSAPVDLNFQAWVMTSLYAHRGGLFGVVGITPETPGGNEERFASGGVDWCKAPNMASLTNYPQGFYTSVNLIGGTKYLPPKTPPFTSPFMMNAQEGTDNLYVSVYTVGGLATLERNHAVKFGKGPDENPLLISGLTFNAALGTFTGSSSYSDKQILYDENDKPHLVTLTKPFKFQGIVIRPPSPGAGPVAMGFAIIPTAYALNRFTNISVPVMIYPSR